MTTRPTMPKSDPNAAALFQTLLPADPRVTLRPMFGHAAAFVNGHMFAGTFGSQMFVRLDEPARAELLAVPGATPFAPMKDRPMKDYVQLPQSMLAERSSAKSWVTRAFEWTSTLPAKTKAGRNKGQKARNSATKRKQSRKRR